MVRGCVKAVVMRPMARSGSWNTPELPQQGRPVVVDPLTRQAIGVVERVDAAERKLDLRPGRRQPTPWPEVLPANHDLEHDRGGAGMRVSHLDLQSRERLQ